MSKENKPAFAAMACTSSGSRWTQEGMSLRTYLAGQAMMGIMASPEAPVSDYEGMAIKALKAADALIELLEKKEK
jgi:hypothetical protein